MNDKESASQVARSPSGADEASAWLSLDEICDRFEAICLRGTAPVVEEFLAGVPESRRLETLRELLRVDVHYRRQAGDSPSFAEYRSRFPQLDSAWLDELLRPTSSPSALLSSAGRRPPAVHDGFDLPNVPGYERLEEIGRGGMGVVFRARQLSLNRMVALKMVLAGELAGPQLLERFRAEARAVARLQHPNLVQIYEVGEFCGRPFLAFELIEGGSLDQRLRGLPQPPRPAAQLLKTLAHAVQFAHTRGIIHRDLKPANILLASDSAGGGSPDSTLPHSENGVPERLTSKPSRPPESGRSADKPAIANNTITVIETSNRPPRTSRRSSVPPEAVVEYGIPKISDFGLAKQSDENVLQTKTGAIFGTPSYMAPEQATGQPDSVGPLADIYSLGAILYEMLTGRPPFRAPTVIETLDQVRSQEPIALRHIQPSIPRDLETICLKCLQKDPARRYDSAGALADDFDRFLRDEPVLARPIGTAERTWRWCRRHPLAAVLAALLLWVTVGGVAGIAWQWRQAAYHRQVAEVNATKFRGERDVAEQQRTFATSNLQLAEAEQKRAERSLYFRRIGQAYAEWQAHQVGRADQLLEECPPEMRDWEWSYLKSLCHSDLRTMRGHSDMLRSLAFSPDGRTIASGSGQRGLSRPGEIILWDAESGEPRVALRGHQGPISKVAFSPDSQRIASASSGWMGEESGAVKVWSLAGKELFSLRSPGDNATTLAFSPDGQQLATGSLDFRVRLWDAGSGNLLQTLEGHTGNVFDLAFHPSGQRLASVGRDGALRIWNLASGAVAQTVTGFTDLRRVSYSPDGRFLAFTNYGSDLRIWDLAKPADKIERYSYDLDVIFGLAYSPEGRRIALSGSSRRVVIVDAASGRELKRCHAHSGMVYDVAFSPNGRVLATGGMDRLVKTLDAQTDWNAEVIMVGRLASDFHRMAITPDGTRLLLPNGISRSNPGPAQKALIVWDLARSKAVQTLRGHTGWLTDVAVTGDGTRYATASEDKTARIWNAQTGAEVFRLSGHTDIVTSVALPRSGDRAGTASADGTARLWDISTGQQRHELKGHDGKVMRVAFNSDGRRLATAGHDSTVRIWNADSGAELFVLRGHTAAVTSIAFSHNDQWLASSSEDETIRLWKATTGELIHVLRGHTGTVLDVTFSRDDRRLASAGADWTVKIWDAVSGDEALSFYAPLPVSSLQFHPDGKRLISVHGSNLQVWDAESRTTPQLAAAFDAANIAWHEREAKQCQADKLYAAATFHFGRLIELQPQNPLHYSQRGEAWANQGDWERAAADFAATLEHGGNTPNQISDHAMVQLELGHIDEYRRACQRRLDLLDNKSSRALINNAVWFKVLAPDTVTDPSELVALSKRSLDGATAAERNMYINTLGAALLRSGRFEEARQTIVQGMELPDHTGLAFDWLFLALIDARLGHHDQAREWLKKANDWLAQHESLEQENARIVLDGWSRMTVGIRLPVPTAVSVSGLPPVIPWRDRLTLKILAREAQAAVNNVAAPKP